MLLEVKDINKNFGDKEALKNINFVAESGQAFGLLGRNGAGKTTTIRIIMGIFFQDSGEVLIDKQLNSKTKVKIGYMPEERGLYPKKSVIEQMVYLGQLRGLKTGEAKKRAMELLERLEAKEYFDKKLDTLSKGNQQKIQLAISVINDPDIVILDEPFSGLDPVNAKLLKNLVEDLVKENKIVLFSSHQMSYVEEFCHHICIIKDGQIALDGNLSEIKKSYPRNKISITPEEDLNGFVSMLNDNLQEEAENITTAGDSCIITLKSQEHKPLLLKCISESGLQIDAFKIVEPTLEEIFIERAGDIHEKL